MIELKQNPTKKLLRKNAEQLLLSDPVIRGLFNVVSYNIKEKFPPWAGNFLVFYEDKCDFSEKLYDDLILEYKETKCEPCTLKEMTKYFRANVVLELISLIEV